MTRQALQRALTKYWGYDRFLPLQAEAMSCAMAGNDSVVVLPTGGGKSLCFQAPAVCLDGMAIVVSPLIALMKDQVDALRSVGVPAAFANSTLSVRARREVARSAAAGELRLLYLAPERLLSSSALDFLGKTRISLIAIDEAHCISSWGHDFRPEYRGLGVLKERFPNVGIHAYTATATQRVQHDIAEQLRLSSPEILVGSFDRPNLVYRVRRRAGQLRQICQVLDRHANESGIVYAISRAEVERIAQQLADRGHRARPYHAGLTDIQRHQAQDAFLKEEINTIVATVAFGMGIDKSNVRYVVHAGMPKSLEQYQQESGRAGRDGLEAECCVFYSGRDFQIWKSIIEESESASRDGALPSLSAMMDFCTGVQCRHRTLVRYFGQALDSPSCGACDVCLGEVDLVDDALVISQKILSCVLRLNERFGGGYTAKVLNGSEDERILQNRHNELSTWGLLSDANNRTIRDWIEQLVTQDYLYKDGEYNILRVTPLGRELLRGEHTPRLSKPRKPAAKSKRAEASWDGVDRALFDRLRSLRRELATARNVPAYVIFGDATLRELARRRPSTRPAMLAIHGIGDHKLAELGSVFLECITQYCQDHAVPTDV